MHEKNGQRLNCEAANRVTLEVDPDLVANAAGAAVSAEVPLVGAAAALTPKTPATKPLGITARRALAASYTHSALAYAARNERDIHDFDLECASVCGQ